jgi:clostripain
VYEITWDDKNSGNFTGEIKVSAYNADRSTAFFTDSTSGLETISTEKSGRICLAVKRNGKAGTFSVSYNLVNPGTPDTWTFMCYFNASNLNQDVNEAAMQLVSGFHANTGINLILLLNEGFAGSQYPFAQGFTDTRLFLIDEHGVTRMGGGTEFPEISLQSEYKANMGDAVILKKYINFCKANFPADKYALLVFAHGKAAKGFSFDGNFEDDGLHPGEIGAVLESAQSVDFIGFMSCLMGNLETAYQFRNDPGNTGFTADFMAASVCVLFCTWNYSFILERIQQGGGTGTEPDSLLGGNERIFDPAAMEASDLGAIIVEEFQDWRGNVSVSSCYDLAKVRMLKTKIDELAVLLSDQEMESAFSALKNNSNGYYDTDWRIDLNIRINVVPFYELFDLCTGIEGGSGFDQTTKTKAAEVKAAIDEMVVYSMSGNTVYNDCLLSIAFPGTGLCPNGNTIWQNQVWYNANNVSALHAQNGAFGELDWCKDNAVSGNGKVENWFEMLDAWYDPGGNGIDGGYNGYQY